MFNRGGVGDENFQNGGKLDKERFKTFYVARFIFENLTK